MPVITTRDFRANQTKYVTMAFDGEEVILHTRKGNVTLTPRRDNVITPELQKKIDRARKQWREGKCIRVSSHEEMDRFLNSL